MKFTFSPRTLPAGGAVVVGKTEGPEPGESARVLDKKLGGAIAKALAASRFSGKREEVMVLAAQGPYSRVVLAGLGKKADVDAAAIQAAGAAVGCALLSSGEKAITFMADKAKGIEHPGAEFAYGAMLKTWRFDTYRTTQKPEQKPSLAEIKLAVEKPEAERKAFAAYEKLGDSVHLTRQLVSEPGNVLNPVSFAAKIVSELRPLGVKIQVLDEAQIKKLGMNALAGVAQGSANPPRVVIMEWQGKPAAAGKKPKAPLAFIGKGVTFDSGGISLKPGAGMWDMKYDMAGAAVVVGLMHTLAAQKAKVNAVGVVGLVENMPSGTAQRPGDIVKSMSGQTIEVLNTDAEGRLVLADVLHLAETRFKPEIMIDLATLTGAMVVALGKEHAGLFSNDDELSKAITKAGKHTGEKVWRLPMEPAYDRLMDSDAADVKNISGVSEAGSITAAQFLRRFVKDTKWAHIDIAGVAWTEKPRTLCGRGATAFGVRLLREFVKDWSEA